jgi:hypothetical protein
MLSVARLLSWRVFFFGPVESPCPGVSGSFLVKGLIWQERGKCRGAEWKVEGGEESAEWKRIAQMGKLEWNGRKIDPGGFLWRHILDKGRMFICGDRFGYGWKRYGKNGSWEYRVSGLLMEYRRTWTTNRREVVLDL